MIVFIAVVGFYSAGIWTEKPLDCVIESQCKPFTELVDCLEYVSELPTLNNEEYWCCPRRINEDYSMVVQDD